MLRLPPSTPSTPSCSLSHFPPSTPSPSSLSSISSPPGVPADPIWRCATAVAYPGGPSWGLAGPLPGPFRLLLWPSCALFPSQPTHRCATAVAHPGGPSWAPPAPLSRPFWGLPMALATYLDGPPTKSPDVQRPLHILAASLAPLPRPSEGRSWPSRGTTGLSRRPPPSQR